jgi:hypothetical protein
MITEPAELNESARCTFCKKPCIQRTIRNQENATLEATLGIEPSDTFLLVQVDRYKKARWSPNDHRMITAFRNHGFFEALLKAFSIVKPKRSEASRSAVGIMCVYVSSVVLIRLCPRR